MLKIAEASLIFCVTAAVLAFGGTEPISFAVVEIVLLVAAFAARIPGVPPVTMLVSPGNESDGFEAEARVYVTPRLASSARWGQVLFLAQFSKSTACIPSMLINKTR